MAIVVDFDEEVIAGGDSLVRLNADGSFNDAFVQRVNPTNSLGITSILPLSDGRIIIAGAFSKIDGTPRNAVARLNADGTLDPSFDPGRGPFFDGFGTKRLSDITAAALLPDGRLIVAGHFNQFNGRSVPGVARLNQDGSLDLAFARNLLADPSLPARSIALQNDGRILLTGSFRSVGDFGLGRLNSDGSFDASMFLASEGNGYPFVPILLLQPDGRFLVGGPFDVFNNVPRIALTRLNGDPPIRFTGSALHKQTGFGTFGTLNLPFSALPNRKLVLEISDDLREWSPLRTNAPSSSTGIFNDIVDLVRDDGPKRRFYRLFSP
jgi:uncharacterized delta-60 repeat protein